MSQAIGEVLAFGVGVALSPVAIIAVLMSSPAEAGDRFGVRRGLALSLGAVGTLVLFVADGADARREGGPRTG